MGRKKQYPRYNVVCFRITDEEKAELEKAAKGKSINILSRDATFRDVRRNG